MNTELRKNHERLMAEFRSLGIKPKMKVEITGGKPKATFDLRLLNKNQVPKV